MTSIFEIILRMGMEARLNALQQGGQQQERYEGTTLLGQSLSLSFFLFLSFSFWLIETRY